MTWNIRDKIFSPLIVSLSTALILFLVVWIFRNKVEGYPLICIAEPYVSDEGLLLSDIFIINRTGKEWTEDELSNFLKLASHSDETRKPDIELEWDGRKGGRILEIREDTLFNEGKGEVDIIGEAAFRVMRINPKGILKFIVTTDVKWIMTDFNRGDKQYVPFVINYPGG